VTKNRSFSIELKKPRAGASEEAMDAFERDTGAKIPPDYRKFLACQNGGSPSKRNFSFGDKPYQDSVLRFFFGVVCPFEFDLRFALEQYSARIPPGTFPIAIDEFDNLVLMSRHRGSTNQILFWDHEKEPKGGVPLYVAANLDEFLALLEEDEVQECDIATITFESGEICRRVLPSKFLSKDRNAVVDVRDTKVGERIEEFGVTKTIAKIKYTRERKRT
jgi:SMI1 / KNR4 family (SUKH-1)